jgi:hypothetical protein
VGPPGHDRGAVPRLEGTEVLGGRHDASGREHAEQAAECRSLKVPHRGQLMPPLLPKRISSTPARTPRSRPAIVDRIRPTPGSPATKSARQQPNGSSDIIERTTAKKIEAPRRPHTVTVIHACRDHQLCSADPGLGLMACLCGSRRSSLRGTHAVQPSPPARPRSGRRARGSHRSMLVSATVTGSR